MRCARTPPLHSAFIPQPARAFQPPPVTRRITMTTTLPAHATAKEPAQQAADELAFRPAGEPTLGVELELMILDRETGDLAPGAVPILKACATDPVQGV